MSSKYIELLSRKKTDFYTLIGFLISESYECFLKKYAF